MEMKPIKEMMYGVTDFARMRDPARPAYFVDHTDLIRALEKTSYAIFLRPRRFGKSLLCSLLQAYYDVDYADRFEELFGGLKIGENPTAEHGKYLFLDFNFSIVGKADGDVERSFDSYCAERLDKFAEDNCARLPAGVAEAILSEPTCNGKLKSLTVRLKEANSSIRLYVVIDEYDNFTNTILAESRDRYEQLCHGDGFFKQFFTVLKAATTGMDAPVSRMFITGVSPITMDDVTSGFNIGVNISMDPTFSEFAGFTQDDLKEMLAYYRENAGFEFDPGKVLADISDWYDHYRFSLDEKTDGTGGRSVANSTLVLGFMRYFLMNHQYPQELVDENLRTDYRKIRHLITENRKINGNFHKLEDVIANRGCTAHLVRSFQARDMARGDNFVSLLYYFGLLSIKGCDFGDAVLGIPNLTIAEFMHDFIPKAYEDANDIDPRIYDIARGMKQFAHSGDWHPAIDTACEVVSQYLKVRDAIEGERVVQTALCSLLSVAHGPYIVEHEQEQNGGFVDIAFVPELGRYPEIGYALLIELKYLKGGSRSVATAPLAGPLGGTRSCASAPLAAEVEADAQERVPPGAGAAELAKIRTEAIAQLDRYAADHDLARKWNLPSVALKRLVIVFQGDGQVMCEEV